MVTWAGMEKYIQEDTPEAVVVALVVQGNLRQTLHLQEEEMEEMVLL
jgi:hypothetical protein